MIRSQPAIAAPCTTLRPTPPAPITATREPFGTRAALVTAPTPVITAQPIVASASNGMSRATGMAPPSGTTTKSEKQAVPRNGARSWPRACRRDAFDGSLLRNVTFSTRSHNAARPSRQGGAHPTGRCPAEHDVIAGLQARDRRSDLAHDPRTFMAEDERCLRGPVAARRMQVAVADAGSLELDQHFARARRVELGWFDGERQALLPQDRGMNVHGCLDARLYCHTIMKLQISDCRLQIGACRFAESPRSVDGCSRGVAKDFCDRVHDDRDTGDPERTHRRERVARRPAAPADMRDREARRERKPWIAWACVPAGLRDRAAAARRRATRSAPCLCVSVAR